ncbi:hypothetical protein DLJ53_16665 [Acuticoccus sediminis]|uniref:Glycosyl transferase family 2 n=1 Tax=Acuticoccus sediminis TaxID=2184697 RepID=A0A8B2NUA1_9HYPH|nr:glycosyltransferase family 2 protein [Acuticoccus sediminis]RAI00865.1 hypothetical protein DLJ53_16665 [Acuticoccus sediminis]
MRICVWTMVYNESFNLPIWLRYYGRQFGEENLFVVDHGSDDGSTDNIGAANRIRLPRSEVTVARTQHFMTEMCTQMLKFYDYFIYTDCDELLVVDPKTHGSLRDYINMSRIGYLTGIGLNVVQNIKTEQEIDPEKPILQQRQYAQFVEPMCKTLVTRVPISWDGGYHFCDKTPVFGAVYNLHIKRVDVGVTLRRAALIRTVPRSDGGGVHQRLPDEELKAGFEHFSKRELSESFDFSNETRQFSAKLGPVGRYIGYRQDQKRQDGKAMHRIPESFRDLF